MKILKTIKYKGKILVIILVYSFMLPGCTSFKELQLNSVKTTMLELGVAIPSFDLKGVENKYSSYSFKLSIDNRIFIVENDTIFFKPKEYKINKIINTEMTRRYPGDGLFGCILPPDSKENCPIGETFYEMLDYKGNDIVFFLGTSIHTQLDYLLFILGKHNYGVLTIDEILLLLSEK